MDTKMNQIAKLDVIPSGRRVREVLPRNENADQLDLEALAGFHQADSGED